MKKHYTLIAYSSSLMPAVDYAACVAASTADFATITGHTPVTTPATSDDIPLYNFILTESILKKLGISFSSSQSSWQFFFRDKSAPINAQFWTNTTEWRIQGTKNTTISTGSNLSSFIAELRRLGF